MIKMQGGVFGAVASSAACPESAPCLPERPAAPIAAAAGRIRAPALESIGMTKVSGSLGALDDVSIAVEPGAFHALLGDACFGQDDRPNATWEPRWPCWRASAERWREGP
jgi:hypothetical protein